MERQKKRVRMVAVPRNHLLKQNKRISLPPSYYALRRMLFFDQKWPHFYQLFYQNPFGTIRLGISTGKPNEPRILAAAGRDRQSQLSGGVAWY